MEKYLFLIRFFCLFVGSVSGGVWGVQTPDHDMDEFIPDVSDEMNKSLLNKMSEDADVSHFYKTKAGKSGDPNGEDDDDKSDSEVPSDLLLTSDKIPEIEEEEATVASFPSSYEDEIELPRGGYQSYEPATKQVNVFESSDDSDDSISRGLNFNDVSLPDAPRSGADGLSFTPSSISGNYSLLAQPPSSVVTAAASSMAAAPPIAPTSSSQPVGNSSPTWNIVNNLWDAAQSCIPEIVPPRVPAAVVAAVAAAAAAVGPPPATGTDNKHAAARRMASADLSSDESDFELLDTDDLNIGNT